MYDFEKYHRQAERVNAVTTWLNEHKAQLEKEPIKWDVWRDQLIADTGFEVDRKMLATMAKALGINKLNMHPAAVAQRSRVAAMISETVAEGKKNREIESHDRLLKFALRLEENHNTLNLNIIEARKHDQQVMRNLEGRFTDVLNRLAAAEAKLAQLEPLLS